MKCCSQIAQAPSGSGAKCAVKASYIASQPEYEGFQNLAASLSEVPRKDLNMLWSILAQPDVRMERPYMNLDMCHLKRGL